jgi:predicted PhzF superfamily epimerase YddE/YHI9
MTRIPILQIDAFADRPVAWNPAAVRLLQDARDENWMQSERLGQEELTGFQASTRGGVVGIGLTDDRVMLAGKAITMLEGHL